MGCWTRCLTPALSLLVITGTLANHLHQEEGHYDYEQESMEDGHEMGSAGHGLEHDWSEGHGMLEKEGHGLLDMETGESQRRGHEFPLGDEETMSEEDEEEAPLHLVSKIDPATPAISLTAEPGYNGAELFFDGSSLSLPWPFTAKSHRFKGGINWTIYPGKNYTGSPSCLVADPGHHVTSNGNHQVVAGSIRRGCWCNDSMMVTPRPRSQSTVPSAVQLWAGRNGEGGAVYTDGKETRLPYAFDMASFQLVGTWIPWTLFGGPDLTGDSSCLVADPEGSEGNVGYVFTNIPRPFRVTSIQQDCVAASSFEFAGVEKGVGGKGGKIVDNEIPVIPGPAGAGGKGQGGAGGKGQEGGKTGGAGTGGGQGGDAGGATAGKNETTESGKAKAKERNGKAGTGAGNLKMASVFLTFAPFVVVIGKI